MSEPTVVDKDVVVSLAYKLTVDGEILDEAGAEDALQYLHGNENIIPGLENELTGLKVGDSKKVSVKPEDGYGLTDSEEIEEISLEDFPEGIVPEIGMELEVKDEDGNDLYGRILAITEETVTMDFNHPLAGKTLDFEVTVVGLRAATADEKAHGHVHGPDGHHHH